MKQTLLNRICFTILFIFLLTFFFTHTAHADPLDELDYHETFIRAKVLQVVNEGIQNLDRTKTYNENLKVQLLEGREKGKIVTVGYAIDAAFGLKQQIDINSMVVIDSKPIPSGQMYYSLYEPYRLNNFWWILGVFAILILVVVGKRGIGAMIGLAISLATILFYIIPQTLKGQDSLTVCISGAIVILFVTTYIAHGISLKTTITLISTAFSLIIAAFLSLICVTVTYLVGLGDQRRMFFN